MDKTKWAVSHNLNIYKKFIDDFNFDNKYTKCFFLNAYNHFLAGKILADAGLRSQSYNCLRMGLESEWVGICLVKDVGLSLQLAFGTADKETVEKIKKLQKPWLLRSEISKISYSRLAEKDRKEIYSALSDKSHSKLGSCGAFMANPKSTDPSDFKVESIPAGGLKGKTNISKLLSVVQDVQEFAMAELEDCLNVRLLPDDWKYNRTKLSKISEGAYPNDNGGSEPHVSSQKRPGSDPINAAVLLEAIRKGSFK
jgi:hypothetical protein